MGKTGIKTGGEIPNSFFKVKSYSISEIMAAGGATAFATKMGKKPQNLASRLKDFPQDAFLTNDEAESALETLKNNK